MKRITTFGFAISLLVLFAVGGLAIPCLGTDGRSAPVEENLVRLAAGRMVVEFDKRTGALFSLTEKQGRFNTNYIGNPENVRGANPADAFWIGNIISTVWEFKSPEVPLVLIPSFSFKPSGTWRQESTGLSADIRKVSFDGKTLQVEYVGRSANEGGLRSYDLKMAYAFDADGALVWTIEIRNTTGRPLEVGEFGIPFTINDDYQSVREKSPYTNTVDDKSVLDEDERMKVREQVLIHEQKVTGHFFAGGHSSYALVERLLGDPPFLLIHTAGDTAFECQYRYENPAAGGPRRGRSNVLAIHSSAVKNRRGWRLPWVNGHTSLVLKPGEKKAYQIRFTFVDGYAGVREEISRSGNLGIRVLPSMVVQEDDPVYVEILAKFDPAVSFLSDQCRILEKKRLTDRTLLTLAFKGRGQKSVRLDYEGGKWTNIHFYCTENTAELIQARARFIVERQFNENPKDPYGRNHMFLPFDYRTGSIFADSDEVWEVGGSDEYGFSEPLFLAEKNVYRPDRGEIKTLEAYVEDCLIGHIQNQETFALRASIFWKERTPSSPWGHWTEERSKESYRTYNYPHAANIYHALYRIGKLYGLTSRREPLAYLKLAAQTCLHWFETGPWNHVGVMGGSNALSILEDVRKEGWAKEYEALLAKLKACNDVFVATPYPYSSELFVDQTAHEHVGLFTRYFGTPEKYRKTLQVIQALRGGNQPLWFRFGNDNRGDLACWYTESLNGLPLLKGFEETGDLEMFVQGYAGVMSVTANLLPDGMGFGHFVSTPGIFAHDPPKTLDNGIGMYGYFKGAKAYVLNDASFGLIGCGCRVDTSSGIVRAVPTDGLKKRLLFVEAKIDVEAAKGELKSVALDKTAGVLELEAADTTGLVTSAEIVVKGLEKGEYRIVRGSSIEIRSVSGDLNVALPLPNGAVRIEKMK
jgi:hypothetical protein